MPTHCRRPPDRDHIIRCSRGGDAQKRANPIARRAADRPEPDERIVAIGIVRPESTLTAKHSFADLRRWRITPRAVTLPMSSLSSLCATSNDVGFGLKVVAFRLALAAERHRG